MKEQNSQERSGGGDNKNEVGGFTQVPNHFLETLISLDLTKNEHKLVLFFIRNLSGWRAQFRPFNNEQLIQATGMPKSKLWVAINGLMKKGVLIKKKAEGLKTPLYGFNEKTCGNVIIGDPLSEWKDNSKVIDLVTFKVTKRGTLKVTESDTLSVNQNTGKYSESLENSDHENSPKYTKNKSINIISLELRNFLTSQKGSSKARWERFIFETLEKNPEDQKLLWGAIERVTRTKKDFFGKPISHSIIGLFENSQWELMRDAMINVSKREAEEEQKRIEREKTAARLEEQRSKAIEESGVIDMSNLSPFFRKMAERNMGK